jgi:hypothetical protein
MDPRCLCFVDIQRLGSGQESTVWYVTATASHAKECRFCGAAPKAPRRKIKFLRHAQGAAPKK